MDISAQDNRTEKQKAADKAAREKEQAYDNSWEKNHAAGYEHIGIIKTRVPTKDTNFDKLKINHLDWDFVKDGVEYNVISIPGYPHSYDNHYYIYKSDEELTYDNLIPHDDRWRGNCVEFSFNVFHRKTWRIKWDEYRTSSHWACEIKRNDEILDTVRGENAGEAWALGQAAAKKLEWNHELNIWVKNWKEKLVGEKIKYGKTLSVIGSVSVNPVQLFVVPVKDDEVFECPDIWNNDDPNEICNRQRWLEDYADGMWVPHDDQQINWYPK